MVKYTKTICLDEHHVTCVISHCICLNASCSKQEKTNNSEYVARTLQNNCQILQKNTTFRWSDTYWFHFSESPRQHNFNKKLSFHKADPSLQLQLPISINTEKNIPKSFSIWCIKFCNFKLTTWIKPKKLHQFSKYPRNKILLANYQSVTPDHFSEVTIPNRLNKKKSSKFKSNSNSFSRYKQKPL